MLGHPNWNNLFLGATFGKLASGFDKTGKQLVKNEKKEKEERTYKM